MNTESDFSLHRSATISTPPAGFNVVVDSIAVLPSLHRLQKEKGSFKLRSKNSVTVSVPVMSIL